MFGRWRHWFREQRVGYHTRLDHSDHAHAWLVGLADEKMAQDCSRLHVRGRSLVSELTTQKLTVY